MNSEILATITYTPILDDYSAYYELSLTLRTKERRNWARFVLFVACWAASLVSLATATALTTQSVIASAFCSITFIWLFILKMWPDPKRTAEAYFTAAKNAQFFASRTLQFESSGVRHISENSETWYRWNIVRRVILTEQHVFIQTPTTILLAPARVFESHDQFLDFVRVAQHRYVPESDESQTRGFPVVINRT